MGIPRALASLEREITQPSLLESTTTGLLRNDGSKTRSQETKKLLQSRRANNLGILKGMNSVKNNTPYFEIHAWDDLNGFIIRIFSDQKDFSFLLAQTLDGEFTI